MSGTATGAGKPSVESWRQRLRGLIHPYLTDPIVGTLAAVGVTPNLLTVLGFLISIGAGVLLGYGHFVAGGAVVLAGSLMDLLDGALARKTGKVSRTGAFLDSTLDRLSEAVILFGLLVHFAAAAATEEVLLIFAVLTFSVLVSYIRARAEGIGYSCTVGLVTRPERVVLLALGLIIGEVTILLYILASASFFTAAHRFVHVWNQARRDVA